MIKYFTQIYVVVRIELNLNINIEKPRAHSFYSFKNNINLLLTAKKTNIEEYLDSVSMLTSSGVEVSLLAWSELSSVEGVQDPDPEPF